MSFLPKDLLFANFLAILRTWIGTNLFNERGVNERLERDTKLSRLDFRGVMDWVADRDAGSLIGLCHIR